MRLAAVGDLHYSRTRTPPLQRTFSEIADQAEALLLCGDLTDFGLEEEARLLARDLSGVRVPILAVLGNHDYEGGRPDVVRAILADAGVVVLDGESTEIRGVGFVGVKGFGGGFGRRVLEPWGEPSLKAFVQEAVDEALKLERALSRLRSTKTRVALLHYSPIKGTIEGESLEIYPFLGSSRLEEPLNRFRVSAIFHGHAHHGVPESTTSTGIPVYNVAWPMLRRLGPDAPNVRIVDVTGPPPLPEPAHPTTPAGGAPPSAEGGPPPAG